MDADRAGGGGVSADLVGRAGCANPSWFAPFRSHGHLGDGLGRAGPAQRTSRRLQASIGPSGLGASGPNGPGASGPDGPSASGVDVTHGSALPSGWTGGGGAGANCSDPRPSAPATASAEKRHPRRPPPPRPRTARPPARAVLQGAAAPPAPAAAADGAAPDLPPGAVAEGSGAGRPRHA
nr:uncharacterized protein LOC127322014 [Lolium perenne]